MRTKCLILALLPGFIFGCSLSISKKVTPISVEKVKAFVSQNNMPTPVFKGDYSLMKKLSLADDDRVRLPSVLLINPNLEIVYIQRGYTSSFQKDLKEAIDCNIRFCEPNSKYVKMKRQYAGKKTDNIELVDIEGNTVLLQELFKDNSLLVLDVWATWCKPCMKATKEIEALKIDYPGEIRTVSISHDTLIEK